MPHTHEVPDDYVRMEQAVCPVCHKVHNHGGILMNMKLKSIPEEKALTHIALCEEHQKLFDEGYVAIVETDYAKSETTWEDGAAKIKPSGAYLLGRCIHIRKEKCAEIINVPIPDGGVMYCDPAVIDLLADRAHPADIPEDYHDKRS